MALIDRLIGPAIGRYMEALNKPFGGMKTASGSYVTSESAFEVVPVRAAINVLSQDVATLPIKLYQKRGRSRTEVTAHPLANALDYPNPRMTGFELRESMMVSLLTWGNAYCYIQRDANGSPVALWPLRPDCMSVLLGDDRRVIYSYSPSNDDIQAQDFDSYEILHVKGMSADGIVGRTPLYDWREKLGEVASMERFSQSFYGNGMKRSAVLKHPSTLTDKARENILRSTRRESGVDNAWKVLVLEEGMDFSELSFAPEDAQLLDTRRFGVEDVCRIFNLPPYKLRINTPGSVSYASVDAQSVDYLVSTLTPWLVRIEQAINRACLSYNERQWGFFVEHNTHALLRSDLKSQAEALAIGRDKGWYSINDCRAHLGENPVNDPRADDYFAPTYVQATANQMGEHESSDDDVNEDAAEVTQESNTE